MERHTTDWVEDFLHYSENSEPPVIFRRWVAIGCLAAVLQRKCWVELGVEVFYPNFYIILVGPPASRKGTALRFGTSILDRIGLPVAADAGSRQKLIDRLVHSNVTEGAGNLTLNHSSLTIISTELTVFLGYQNLELLSDLCKWFDCEPRYLYETHSRGEEEVINVWVNLLGATTPMLLQTSLPEGAIGSGFTSRAIFVYASDKGKVVPVPFLSPEQKELKERLFLDLAHIRGLAGEFRLSKAALDLYCGWRLETEEHPPFSDPKLDFYNQRRPCHILKLAMICSIATNDSQIIEEDDMAKAIWTLEETEKDMPKVFQGVGNNRLAAIQIRLERMLEVKKKLSLQEIHNTFYSDANNAELGDILASLESRGICRISAKHGLVFFRTSPMSDSDLG